MLMLWCNAFMQMLVWRVKGYWTIQENFHQGIPTTCGRLYVDVLPCLSYTQIYSTFYICPWYVYNLIDTVPSVPFLVLVGQYPTMPLHRYDAQCMHA